MGLPDRSWAKRLLDHTSRGLLALHVLLALYYASYSLLLMFLINLACAFCDGMGPYLLRKGKARTHILTLYISELLQIMVSVILLGWSAGFQLPLIGLTAIVFLGEYLSRSLKLQYIPALPLAIVDFGVYVLAYPRFFYAPGVYGLPQSAVCVLQLLWSSALFALLIWGLLYVVRLSSASEHSLTNKAETDELTGLINRAGYDRLLEELELKNTILLLVDTDKFKGINDRYGHETGDRVLKKISKSLLANFRQNDYVCRIGGDEFAVLMLNTGALEDERIQDKIRYINRELATSAADELPTVSVSVGAARGTGAEDWTTLFKQADSVLYKVKQEGGRGCIVYRA